MSAVAGDASSSSSSSSSSSNISKETIKTISIPTGRLSGDAVYYYITCSSSVTRLWTCRKRFTQFESFHSRVQSLFGSRFHINLELPPKKFKFITSHTSPQFIEERRVLLESYMKKLVLLPVLPSSELLLDFLHSDEENEIVAEEKKGAAANADGVDTSDLEITGITIPSTRTMSDHILFQIDLVNENRRRSFQKWTVLKRFGQFYEFDSQMRSSLTQEQPEIIASLPPPPTKKTKLLQDHFDEKFIEERRVLMENYLNKLLKIPACARHKTFLQFLGVQV